MNIEEFDFNVFFDEHVKAKKYAKSFPYQCCCPGCDKKAIKSHLMQQHPILESICDEKNSLLQMVDNDIDPRSGNWDFYNRQKVGITNAFQCKLFCSKHDTILFKKIENQNSIPKSKKDCLLIAFRAACAVRYQEERRLHVYEKLREMRGLKSPLEDNSLAFIQRMNAVVNNLWSAINGLEDEYYVFRMIAMPKIGIAASDCMTDEKDLEEHILDENYDKPLNSLFINLIPLGDKLFLLLGCDTRYDKNEEFKRIITNFPTGDISSDVHLKTLKGILLKCKNWCCSPALLDEDDWKSFFEEYEELKVRSTLK